MENGYLTYLGYLSKKVTHLAELKTAAATILSVTTFFFDPVQQVSLIALFVLIIIDFAFGVTAARKTGDAVRSSKLVRTALKIAVYFSLIAAARVTEHAIPALGFLDETVTGFLAATELLSIVENAGRLGYAVPRKLTDALGDYIGEKNRENGLRGKINKNK